MLYESLCPSPLGAPRGEGALLESARFYWTRCGARRSAEDALKNDGLKMIENAKFCSLARRKNASSSDFASRGNESHQTENLGTRSSPKEIRRQAF